MTQSAAGTAVPAAKASLLWKLWHGATVAHVRCSGCGAALGIAGLEPGARARCGRCGSVFTVPGGTAAPEPAAPEPAAGQPASESSGATPTPAVLEKPPRKVGPYLLETELARGGTAIVFKGRHETLNKPVAVKLLLPGIGERFAASAEEMNRRLFREALTLARFRHPHIVPVLDAGRTPSGVPYLAMEFVDGEDLARHLKRRGPLPAPEALAILAQVIEGVDFAHAQGVVHRDLKPGNVLIDANGDAQLVDFGLARDDAAASRLTQSGVALGTPSYMPPEQARGERDRIGPRSDVYSLGAILYEMLTGRPPFEGERVMEVLYKVCHDEPRPPRLLQPQVPREAEAICLLAMRKDPAARYASAYQMLQDVRAVLRHEPPPVAWAGRGNAAAKFLRRKGLWNWKGVALAVVALGALGIWGEHRERLRQVRRLVYEGHALLETGDLAAADEKFVEALRHDPDDGSAFMGRGEVRRQREAAERKKAEAASDRDAKLKNLMDELKLDPAKLDPARLQELLKATMDQLGQAVKGTLDPAAQPGEPPRKPQDPAAETPAAGSACKVELVATAPGTAVRVHAATATSGSVPVAEGRSPLSAALPRGVYVVRYRTGKDARDREYILTLTQPTSAAQKVALPE